MEFRILGPLEVIDRGRRLALGGAKQRALLAVLLVHPNQVVSTDRLIDSLWGDRPPETAQTALQVHVSQLRKLLGPNRILTEPTGYVLRISPDELDLTRFEELVRANAQDRPSKLREALALWRGPALADFSSEPFAQGEAARLEEMRLAATEDGIEDDLASGRHRELVGELESLIREHPLRERLRGQLMVALYRSGRQAEALALYRETRRTLVEELGIDPSAELQQLEGRILKQDAALAAPPARSGTAAAGAATETVAPQEERKVVSIVFADLVGFTSRAERLDPEDVNALVSPYYLRLRAELERHGGTVEKFVGDAVMAVFGAPVAHEDDAERAVRAALAIRDWLAEQGDDLQARIAVNTGEALVRLGANPSEGEGMAVGDVVNTAARLQQSGPAGGVVVGEATYRVTRDTIAYEPLEPAAVKGKGKPVPIWLAKGPELGRDGAARTNAPFVGRQDEFALLKQTYARALRESSVQLVTIVGEPGIGKTRLVGEFRDFVESEPSHALWRQGRCLSYGEGITFWALGQIVKAQADILESDDPDEAARKLAAAVDAAADRSDAHWLHSRLAPLVGASSNLPLAAQEEAFTAWRTFLEAIAARQPLVLVIEDLHWADSALLAFIDHLIEWSAEVPMLVIGTARPEIYERAAAWGGGKRNSTTIALGPLNDEETTRLISDLLARATLPQQIQTTVLERAGGNPLYAEEFVRMLDDRGLLTGRGEGLEITPDADITVPETIHAVIAARLDTLAADRKALVHDAAVIGKVFWAGALAEMGHASKESVLTRLHELVRKELVRRARMSSIEEDVEYTFWHALVRDVAYGQIPRAARARKHVAAAEWIERIAGERVTDHAEFLATHYRTALQLAGAAGETEQAQSLTDRAVRFGELAGKRAIRLHPGQGERYYRQTLQLLPEGDPRRPKLLADAAGAGTVAGVGFEQIKVELEEAIAALRAHGDVVAAADAMRQLSFAMYGRRESLPLAEEARRLLESEPPGPEIALVYARLAQEHGIAGHNKEVVEWSEKALPLLERFGLNDEALGTQSGLAAARCGLSDLAALDDLRELAREAIDPDRDYGAHTVTMALNNLAVTEYWFGAGPAATVKALRAAADLAGRRGLERPTKWYTGNMADPLYDLGQWDEVLRIHEQIAAWERVRGQSLIGIFASPSAARILAARGDLLAAGALVQELLPRAREVENTPLRLAALTAAASVAAARGELPSASDLIDEFGQVTADVTDLLGYLAEIGRVCARVGDLGPLERLLDRGAHLDPRLDRFVASGHAILAEAKGDHSGAESTYSRLASAWEEYRCVVEQAHALTGLGRCRLALGRLDEATAPLHEARAIFESLKAHSLGAETDSLVGRAAARPS